MKTAFFALLAALATYAQVPGTPKFPGASATDSDLLCASNNFSGSLVSPITAIATTMQVSNTTGLCVPSLVTVGTPGQVFEVVKVIGISGNILTIVRGQDGSGATSHLGNAPVAARITAEYHHTVAREVKAVEECLKSSTCLATLPLPTSGGGGPPTGAAGGDLGGSYPNPAVSNVPGTATINSVAVSLVTTGANLANNSTSTNSPSTIVRRDSSGNFVAGTITAALTGNAATATALAADPSPCPAGQYASDIAANGALTCSTPAGGGGGGATNLTSITDCQVTRTSATVLTFGAAHSSTAPCTVAFGSTPFQFQSSTTITVASVSVTVRVKISDGSDGQSAGTVMVLNSGASGVTCSGGCAVVNSQAGWTIGGFRVVQWVALSGAWDTTGTDLRGAYQMARRVVAGDANIAVVSTDTTDSVSCTGCSGGGGAAKTTVSWQAEHNSGESTFVVPGYASSSTGATLSLLSGATNGEHGTVVTLAATGTSIWRVTTIVPSTYTAASLRVRFAGGVAGAGFGGTLGNSAVLRTRVSCIANGGSITSPTYNAFASTTITIAAFATGFQSELTPSDTGCDAGERIVIEFQRDGDNGSDNWDAGFHISQLQATFQ